MADLFLGYIQSVGKKPIGKIIGGNYLQVPPENSDYVGVLRPGYVQIDLDNKEDAELLYKILVEKKVKCDVLETKRGLHFYFKNSNRRIKQKCTHRYCAIGLPVDTGVGGENCVIPLRVTYKDVEVSLVNGKEINREVSTTITRRWRQTFDEVDEVPCWLTIVSKQDIGISRINDGGGRNSFLFAYKPLLATAGLNGDEIASTLKIINDYLLKDPLPDKELRIIARDENFEGKFFFDENGKFLHDIFGTYLVSACNIVDINDTVYLFNRDELFSNKIKDFERAMVDRINNLKTNQRKEVYNYIMLQNLKKENFASPKYIGLKDYVLDLESMDKLEYSSNLIIRNKIDFNLYEDSYDELMDITLNKVCCGDSELRALLEEMIGYCLFNSNKFQVCFILTGCGSNGKSVILNLIQKLLGVTNYSTLSMQELEDRFKPSELDGMLANIGDDISDKYLTDTSMFKKCVVGDPVTVERKHEKPFTMRCQTKFIFATNNPPKASDKTAGFLRRLIFIPFNAKFSKTDPDFDPFIEDKLMTQQSMEYLLNIAIKGLKRLLENNEFTKSEASLVEFKKYERENNNVLDWLSTDPKLNNEKVSQVYQDYCFWCAKEGCKPFNNRSFKSIIKENTLNLVEKITTVNGVSTRIYKI